MFKILRYAKTHKLSKVSKHMKHIYLYFDCMYYEMNLYQIRFLVRNYIRNMRIHIVPSPEYQCINVK